MSRLVPIDHPEVAPFPISTRLRNQIVYFASMPGTEGVPELGEKEFFIAEADVARWLDDGILHVVSPLDTANMTEVELSDEQEALLSWLQSHHIQHVRLDV